MFVIVLDFAVGVCYSTFLCILGRPTTETTLTGALSLALFAVFEARV